MVTRRELFSELMNLGKSHKGGSEDEINTTVSPACEPYPSRLSDIPELDDNTVYYEAMRLGIDPSTESPEDLRARIIHAIAEQKPS